MSKEKKLVMWTVFMVSLLQMINMAIMPAVNRIATDAFPQFTLSSIQIVLSLRARRKKAVSAGGIKAAS